MTNQDDFDARMTHLAELIEDVERNCAPNVLEPARALLRAVLDVHQSGLREILTVLSAPSLTDGEAPLSAICAHPSIASLLMMHDLHPDAFAQRVTRALDAANAAEPAHVLNGNAAAGTMLPHRAHAELVHMDPPRVRVRVHSAEPGLAVLLRRTVERLMCEHAPDADLTLEGGESMAKEQLIPLTRLARARDTSL